MTASRVARAFGLLLSAYLVFVGANRYQHVTHAHMALSGLERIPAGVQPLLSPLFPVLCSSHCDARAGCGYLYGAVDGGQWDLLSSLFSADISKQCSGNDGCWRGLVPFLGILYVSFGSLGAVACLAFGRWEASIVNLFAALAHLGMCYVRLTDAVIPATMYASTDVQMGISYKQGAVALVHVLVATVLMMSPGEAAALKKNN